MKIGTWKIKLGTTRLHCPTCELVWSRHDIYTRNCSKCLLPLQFKSFYPVLKIVLGSICLIAGLATVLGSESAVIWIGGFLVGLGLIGNGFSNWKTLKKLDGKYEKEDKEQWMRENIPGYKSK